MYKYYIFGSNSIVLWFYNTDRTTAHYSEVRYMLQYSMYKHAYGYDIVANTSLYILIY